MTAVVVQPFVAVLTQVPLVTEVIVNALGEIADVRAFASRGGDTVGLLRSLGPDAIVVDDVEQAEPAAEYARVAGIPVLYLSLRERKLLVLDGEGWRIEADDPSTESLRNALAGAMYGRAREPSS